MTGFVLEIKRNDDCSSSDDLAELVHLGELNPDDVYDRSSGEAITDGPRTEMEFQAMRVLPPLGGQDPRAPVDGVSRFDRYRRYTLTIKVTTKRCQEWTMEYLNRLASMDFISRDAVEIVQRNRDPPHHGIFGAKGDGPSGLVKRRVGI